MARLSKRRRSLILLGLVLLIVGSSVGVASALYRKTPVFSSIVTQAQIAPTPPPACLQLPRQIDWQHLSMHDFAKYGLPNPPTSLADLAQWLPLVQRLKHRSCSIAVPSSLKIHAVARSSVARSEQSCSVDRRCQNPGWAGGIATQRPYRDAEATWLLPCVKRGVRDSASSAWVGLGGAASRATLVQAGVDTEVNAQGQLIYTAWAEAYTPASASTPFHDSQVELVFAQGVHCGDRIYVQVSSDVRGKVDRQYPDTYFVGDMTTGEYQYYNPSWQASDGSTAEWIVERPTFTTGQTFSQKPLTNFGSLTFTFCLAYVAGQGFLADTALPLQLVSMQGERMPLATSAVDSLATLVVHWKQST